MDIADHRPAGFGHPGVGLVGDIGGHTLVRHQPRPLPYQHADQLAAGDVADGVAGTYPAIADKERLTHIDSSCFQAILDGCHAVHGVGGNGCGRNQGRISDTRSFGCIKGRT